MYGEKKNPFSLKFRICFPKYFFSLLSILLSEKLMHILLTLKQCLGSLQRKRKNAQMILPVSYIEIQSNCVSSEIDDDFSATITVKSMYKNSV